MKKLSWILLLSLSSLVAEATHQVSGYISFKCLHGTTYRVTLYDYTNTCNTEADRDSITVRWGDGSFTFVVRSNGSLNSHGFRNGVPVCECRKVSIYDTVHTFPGPGTYHISIDDQDRMANINNMIQSVNVDFYLFASITLNPLWGDSIVAPVIANAPVCVHACPNRCFYFNLGAYSQGSDSVVYSLGNCLSAGSAVANGYFIPHGASIDRVTGTLKWCSPPAGQGIYNFAIDLVTYKRLYIGNRIVHAAVDTMEVELEIIVDSTCVNEPPFVKGPSDTCIVAGDLLHLTYIAGDSDGDLVSLAATGAPFSASPPATAVASAPANPASLQFSWATNCTEVKRTAYPLLITATDIYPPTPDLNAYQATNIFIVGPAPKHLVATPSGNSINLHWNPSLCSQATGYQVYRHIGCNKWLHAPCETGVPAYTGYTLIGTTAGLYDTTFTDDDGGRGLVPGIYYDYMVVATYPLPDGSLSYASNDTCLKLRRDVPILTNVSVDNTDPATGTIFVRWIRPLADITDLDTIADPGPYTYKLMRAAGINGNSFSQVASYSAPFFNSFIDSTYKDVNLNTTGQGYNYRVDFYSNGNLVGSSPSASSIYLTVKPDNNMLHLSWLSKVPWNDSAYMIYRSFPAPVTFLASVPGTQHTYTDSGLTNLKTFCYYVESKSFYSDTTILHPLSDSSEVMCGSPKDTIAPCSPHLTISPVCNLYHDSLVWDNPDYFCPKVDNRILYYEVFFSPTQSDEPQLIATIYNLKDTVFVHDSIYSIAGCFSVIAVDSFMNRSPLNMVCVDNCPLYELPNIFTPNGDGKYDFFTPILPYRFIKNIDISIINRWGQVMYHTLDPMINWNGNDQASGKPCPDGVYYYVCQVYEIHLDGIKPRTLKGFIHLQR